MEQLTTSIRKATEAMQEVSEALKGPRRPTSARAARRHAARHDGGLAKKATRKYRRDAIEGLQNQQTALGLARVYLGNAGTPAMQHNVVKHVHGLAEALSAQEDIGWIDAHDRIVARLQEVLDGSR